MKSLSVHPIIKQCYKREIFLLFACRYMKSPYLCIVFFIVLDLRLTKVGVQRYSFFYAHTFTSSSQPAFTPLFLRSGIHSGFPFFAWQQARRCENIRQTMPLNRAVVEAQLCGRWGRIVRSLKPNRAVDSSPLSMQFLKNIIAEKKSTFPFADLPKVRIFASYFS